MHTVNIQTGEGWAEEEREDYERIYKEFFFSARKGISQLSWKEFLQVAPLLKKEYWRKVREGYDGNSFLWQIRIDRVQKAIEKLPWFNQVAGEWLGCINFVEPFVDAVMERIAEGR